jgi:hypothetical protein
MTRDAAGVTAHVSFSARSRIEAAMPRRSTPRTPPPRTILDDISMEVYRAFARGQRMEDLQAIVNEAGARELLAAGLPGTHWQDVAGQHAVGVVVVIDEHQAERLRVSGRRPAG